MSNWDVTDCRYWWDSKTHIWRWYAHGHGVGEDGGGVEAAFSGWQESEEDAITAANVGNNPRTRWVKYVNAPFGATRDGISMATIGKVIGPGGDEFRSPIQYEGHAFRGEWGVLVPTARKGIHATVVFGISDLDLELVGEGNVVLPVVLPHKRR